MLSSFVTGCPTKDSLETCAKSLSTLVNRSTALVAAGVALELVEPIYEFWAWIKRLRFRQKELANFKEVAEFMPTCVQYRRKHVGFDHPTWLKWFGRIGIILVVLGVIGEARYGAELEDAQSAIHEHDTALLGDAANSAKTAHEQVHAVDAKAKDIDTRLGVTLKQLDGVEEIVAEQRPRWELIDDAAPELIKELLPFKDQRVWLYICGSRGKVDGETIGTWSSLYTVLNKKGASWNIVESPFWDTCNGAEGISVFTVEKLKGLLPAAQNLTASLTKVLPSRYPPTLSVIKPQLDFWQTVNRTEDSKRSPTMRVAVDTQAVVVVIGVHPQNKQPIKSK
jgi:hypothetical protein